MMILKKLKLTNKVLLKKAKPIDFKNPKQNLHLSNMMLGFMKEQNGIGLAAPQVGLSIRMFVMQTNHDPAQHAKYEFIFNPEIISVSKQLVQFKEGCLSFPKDYLDVIRPVSIHARFQNWKGDELETRLWGLSAICFQHELDHLDGIVMHDRANNETN